VEEAAERFEKLDNGRSKSPSSSTVTDGG
jgi:hypothetical protein